MWALVLVSFSTFSCIISTVLAVHILWQRMSCLQPFLLAALTMIISEKAASRGGTFQKFLTPPFSPTCLGHLNVIDSGSKLQNDTVASKSPVSHKHFSKPRPCQDAHQLELPSAASHHPLSRKTSKSKTETSLLPRDKVLKRQMEPPLPTR